MKGSEKELEEVPIIAGTKGIRLWEYRHAEVHRILTQNKCKKVLDIGCSDAKFIQRLTRSTQYTLLVGVDIDQQLLRDESSANIVPEGMQQNIIYHRQEPLVVKLYHGDGTKPLSNLKQHNFDCITMIEVIEHLEQQQIQHLNRTLFQFYKVKYVVMTTPNKDFNHYFSFNCDKMRHWDHKFEWDQREFKQYCQMVKEEYHYDYELFGVGKHSKEGLDRGYCSQGVIFKRREGEESSTTQPQFLEHPLNGTLISQPSYPFWRDSYKSDLLHRIIQFCYNQTFHPSNIQQKLENIIKDQRIQPIIARSEITHEELLCLIKSDKSLIIDGEQNITYSFYLSESEGEDNPESYEQRDQLKQPTHEEQF